jgi:hypothetical protein
MGSLSQPIPTAEPTEPDVPVTEVAPGGILVPLRPGRSAPKTPTVRSNEFLLQFTEGAGMLLTLKRIYLAIPVILQEWKEPAQGNTGLEILEETTSNTTIYSSAEEALNIAEGHGGLPVETEEITPISYAAPYSKTNTSYSRGLEGSTLTTKEKSRIERTIIPITIQLEVTLRDASDALWAETYDVAMHQVVAPYLPTTPGRYTASGLVNGYADLTNPIPLRPDLEKYGIALSVFVPSKLSTIVAAGQQPKENAEGKPGPGEITLLYDTQPAPTGR